LEYPTTLLSGVPSKEAQHRTPAAEFFHILSRLSLSLYTNPNLPSSLYQLINPKPDPKFILGDIGKALTDDDTNTTASALMGISASSLWPPVYAQQIQALLGLVLS
jgi:hypothetical protein